MEQANKATNSKELFEEYKRTNSTELRNSLVEKYLYIVDILVRKYINKGVEYDDLYQVGAMGLVLAVERYDYEMGFEFSSFATPTVIGEIKRYFRDKGWAMKVPRRMKEISSRITAIREELYAKLHRNPTISELASALDYSEEDIIKALESSQAYGTYSLNQSFEESDEPGEPPALERFTGIEDTGFASFENAEIIKKVIGILNDKEKDIFVRRFIHNKTQQEIAADMGVSQMTISRLERLIKKKFKDEYYR